jgi:hypothetical protein
VNRQAVEEKLLELMERGVNLQPDGDRLRVDAPKGALGLEDVEFLILYKAGILALLRELSSARLTSIELGEHLLRQSEKAAQSARQAEAVDQADFAVKEWARSQRLLTAALDLLERET